MGYNYVDYIAENEPSYLRSRFILASISLFLITMIFIMERNEYATVEDYHKIEIEVSDIGISAMLKKPNATFNRNKQVKVEALKITSTKNVFFVNRNLEEFWTRIMSEVKKGDELLLYYQVVEGNNEIVQMENNSRILFKLNDLIGEFKTLKITSYFLLCISIIILLILNYKRKRLGTSSN